MDNEDEQKFVSQAIQDNILYLVENTTNITKFINAQLQGGVIDWDTRDQIVRDQQRAEDTYFNFYKLIALKGPTAFKILIDSLRGGTHGTMADKLEKSYNNHRRAGGIGNTFTKREQHPGPSNPNRYQTSKLYKTKFTASNPNLNQQVSPDNSFYQSKAKKNATDGQPSCSGPNKNDSVIYVVGRPLMEIMNPKKLVLEKIVVQSCMLDSDVLYRSMLNASKLTQIELTKITLRQTFKKVHLPSIQGFKLVNFSCQTSIALDWKDLIFCYKQLQMKKITENNLWLQGFNILVKNNGIIWVEVDQGAGAGVLSVSANTGLNVEYLIESVGRQRQGQVNKPMTTLKIHGLRLGKCSFNCYNHLTHLYLRELFCEDGGLLATILANVLSLILLKCSFQAKENSSVFLDLTRVASINTLEFLNLENMGVKYCDFNSSQPSYKKLTGAAFKNCRIYNPIMSKIRLIFPRIDTNQNLGFEDCSIINTQGSLQDFFLGEPNNSICTPGPINVPSAAVSNEVSEFLSRLDECSSAEFENSTSTFISSERPLKD